MPSSSVTRGRSASPIRAKFEAFHASQDGVISPLVFYNFAIEIGVLVPLDVIVTLFKEVDANNDGSIDLDEFLSFIMETDLELKMNPKQIVMKRLLCDPYFWPIAFYLPAGIFFMLGSFFSYKEDPGDFWMASYIVAHIFYIIQPLITLVSYPIELWSNEIEDEKLAQTFKKIILQNANKQSDDLLSEKTDNLTIARYIQEEYFGDGKRFLTKADVEKILIAHMGAVAEEAVVDSIFGRLDVGGQRKIYPDEILLFSMKNHHSVSPLGRLWKTAKTLLGDIGYWLVSAQYGVAAPWRCKFFCVQCSSHQCCSECCFCSCIDPWDCAVRYHDRGARFDGRFQVNFLAVVSRNIELFVSEL